MPRIDLFCPVCRRNYSVADGLFACPRADDGPGHILNADLCLDDDEGPALAGRVQKRWSAPGADSFQKFAPLLASHYLIDPQQHENLIHGLQKRIAHFEKQPFAITTLTMANRLAAALNHSGALWIKNDTGNVTGSHKGRHLMATLLYLEALAIRRRTRRRKPVLAVYSCGNAALAAAAVARAGGYELHAFVPADIDPVVAGMLHARKAIVETIQRADTGQGDPCYVAFARALKEKNWLPFACSGADNWSNIQGGQTLGWETAMQLNDAGQTIDAVVLQVGGGALARAVVQSWQSFADIGLIDKLPRFYACQPVGGFPFVRAYVLMLAAIAKHAGMPFDFEYDRTALPRTALDRLYVFCDTHQDQIQDMAGWIQANFSSPTVQTVLNDAPRQQLQYMWPWDGPAPSSLAHGILDDETYDWYYLLRGLLQTGGSALIIDEPSIHDAWQLAGLRTNIAASATGAAGLAGLMQLRQRRIVASSQSVQLFFTGAKR